MVQNEVLETMDPEHVLGEIVEARLQNYIYEYDAA